MNYFALFFLILIAQSLALTSVSFSGNVSEAEKTAEFRYRHTTVNVFPVNYGIVGGTIGVYTSAEVGVSATNTSGQISGDLIVGAIRFFTNTVPVSYLGYVSAQVRAEKQISGIANNTDPAVSFNYTVAAGFILTSYSRIEERNPSGTVVRTLLLKELNFQVSGGNSNGGLHYVTVTASNSIANIFALRAGEVVSFTFLVSEVLGEVTFGSVKAKLSPKALESVLEVSGWKYVSTSNHLVLVCGVATGAAVGAAAGKVTMASGTGTNQVYAHFAGVADVSGTKKSVSVKVIKGVSLSDVSDDGQIQAQVNAAYAGQLNLAIVEINLPAGADKITYDPSIGAGTPIVDSAQTNFLFALLLAIVVLLI